MGGQFSFSAMNCERGWVKLHRCIWDNPRSKDPDWLAVWVYIFSNVTHQPMPAIFNGQRIILKPGQMITGRIKISSFTGVHQSKVKRVLDVLKSEHQIEQQTCNASSLITVVNWETYQSIEQPNGQPANNQRTTTEQPLNIPLNTVQEQKNRRTEEKSTGAKAPANSDFVGSESNPKPSKEQLIAQFTAIASEIPDEFKPLWNPCFEAEQFIAHFTSNGWKIGGKTRMKSWESATITWRGRFITTCKNNQNRHKMPADKVLAAIEQAIKENPCNPQHPRHQMMKQDNKLTAEMKQGYATLLERRKTKQAEIIKQ